MRARELCDIQKWYPRFSAISFKTLIHPLPETFVSYLLEDGLFLPRCSIDAFPPRIKPSLLDDGYKPWPEEEEEEEEEGGGGGEASGSKEVCPSFPELEAEVNASIAKLGGSVFPKLNWSAPKDSAWISPNGSLKCTNFGEIALLLKSSDSLVHDLLHSLDSCDDSGERSRPDNFVLALRKFYNFHPEMEFRGFVRNGFLVGISQREVTGFYPNVADTADTLEDVINAFFLEHISERFELEDYTFDCYITRSGGVKLMDFNPWGASTLPLLFSWEELDEHYGKLASALTSMVMDDRNMAEEDTVLRHTLERFKLNGDLSGMEMPHGGMRFSANERDQYAHLPGNKSSMNYLLWKNKFKAQFRIIRNECQIRPNLRAAGGVPYDYVNTGPGSAWDEFLRRAEEELQQQVKDCAAGGYNYVRSE